MSQDATSFLILCPLARELKALLSLFKEHGFEILTREHPQLQIQHIAELGWDFAVGGHGKAQFAIQAQHLIERLKPAALFCVGTAGSLNANVRANDLVIADKTIEHDFKLEFVKRPLPEFPGDEALLAKIRATKFAKQTTHYGAIASGDEDIIASERAAQLRAKTNALAVAWEGAGAARAAKFNTLPFLEIRAISDTADDHSIQDFAKNFEQSMRNIGELLLTAYRKQS